MAAEMAVLGPGVKLVTVISRNKADHSAGLKGETSGDMACNIAPRSPAVRLAAPAVVTLVCEVYSDAQRPTHPGVAGPSRFGCGRAARFTSLRDMSLCRNLRGASVFCAQLGVGR